MNIERIAIVGMGALGVLYGDYLTEHLGRERVGFVVNAERRERYGRMEISANGHRCDFRLIDANETGDPADLVIFAVKATALDQAMEDAAGQIGPDTVLLSVLNGITSEHLLEQRFGGRNVVYCVAQGMDAVKLGGALTYTVMGQLCIGVPSAEKLPALDAVCALFDRIGMPYSREEDILHRLWGKFMLNVGVNQVVMVFEGTYGTIQAPGKPREMMIAAMREVLELSRYEGVKLTEDDLNFYVELMNTMSPQGMPSMRQDGLAHRRSEVELFSGTVCRLAKKHGLSVPVNEWLYTRVREMEAAY
ncbi:MAG: ketopantoate reductase family protein [Aristaeellaceae bacterium]